MKKYTKRINLFVSNYFADTDKFMSKLCSAYKYDFESTLFPRYNSTSKINYILNTLEWKENYSDYKYLFVYNPESNLHPMDLHTFIEQIILSNISFYITTNSFMILDKVIENKKFDEYDIHIITQMEVITLNEEQITKIYQDLRESFFFNMEQFIWKN